MAISLLVYGVRVNDLDLGVYDHDCGNRLFGYCFGLKAPTESEGKDDEWDDTNVSHM